MPPKPSVFDHPRHSALAGSRGPFWSALGVAAAAVGCAPPGPQAPSGAVEALREQRSVGAPLNTVLSLLRASAPSAPSAETSTLAASTTPIWPLLVLVHGTPGSASAWSDYLLQPPVGLEVIALDRPGFGQSGPPGAVTTLAGQAAAVAALLPQDGRPVVLLGHSLGGPIVAQVAVDHPDRVTALVLLSASLDPAQESIHPMQFVGAWPLVRSLLPRMLRNANAELMALKPELEALALRLPEIRAKVVIVHGTKDDLVPVANVPFMQARLRGARCVKTVLLDGRNHFLPWNSADVVRAAISQALEPGC